MLFMANEGVNVVANVHSKFLHGITLANSQKENSRSKWNLSDKSIIFSLEPN